MTLDLERDTLAPLPIGTQPRPQATNLGLGTGFGLGWRRQSPGGETMIGFFVQFRDDSLLDDGVQVVRWRAAT